MQEIAVTVWVPREYLKGAIRYANRHNTTLTRLVSEFLRQSSIQDDPLADAPVVRRLSSILPPNASIEDYYRHLGKKHADAKDPNGLQDR